MSGFRRLSESEVHRGHIWRVVTADYESPDGDRFERDVVRSPGSVGVVPVVFDAEGGASVVLVSQFRAPSERVVVEIPAGMRDVEGEDTETVARRELVEEAGLSAGRLERLGEIWPSPGMTDAVCTLYLATDCEPVPTDRQGPEEAHMEIVHLPLDEALAMIDRGELVDAKTVTGLLMTARRLAGADGR